MIAATFPFTKEPWTRYGLCHGKTLEFFPEKGDSIAGAKGLCQRCPVRLKCLEYALRTNQRHGVWGGLSVQERRKIRREAAVA